MTENKSIENYEEQLARIREIFKNDRFATETAGITIEEALPKYARCEMILQPSHLNV